MDKTPQPTSKAVPRKTTPRLGRDALVAAICGLVVVLMVGAAYAAVPFYNWFCRATGFNGTTQVATSAPSSAPLARQNRLNPRSTRSRALPDQSHALHIPNRNRLLLNCAASCSSVRVQ